MLKIKGPHWSFFFWPAVLVAIAAVVLLTGTSCNETPPQAATHATAAYLTPSWPLGPETGPEGRTQPLTLPYALADLGNTDVWAEEQGNGGPVSDNWLTTSPQTRQSPHRKLKDELGTAYHRARVVAYVLDAQGLPIGYKLEGGGFYTPGGAWVAPCTFFAGLDSYMLGMYYDPIDRTWTQAKAWAVTTDGARLPIYGTEGWIAIPVFDGRWWNGDHPFHDWRITGI